MEAAELFHGEQLWTRVRWDSEQALRAWSRTPSIDSLSRTLRRFDTRARIPWIEGFDLCDGLPCWIPAELVHTDYKSSEPSCGDYFLSSSNGLASGNHILEAISSGICEVVERDALAPWERRTTLARARRRSTSATIDNPDCLALLDLYERSGTAVQVWDITTECGIPVFLCDIRPRVHDPSAMSRRCTRSRLSCRSCCRSRQGADGSRAGSAHTHHRYARRHFLRCIRRRPGSKGRSGLSRRPRCSPATPFLQRGAVVHVG